MNFDKLLARRTATNGPHRRFRRQPIWPPRAAMLQLLAAARQRNMRQWQLFGDRALVIELGQTIDPAINREVHALAARIRAEFAGQWAAVVPAYASLLVEAIDPAQLADMAAQLPTAAEPAPAAAATVHRVEVRYGGPSGPDLPAAAAAAGLSPSEFVAAHCAGSHGVYMLGFAPGFAYLGDLDPRLSVDRLATPRRAKAGSVIVAGRQTSILPADLLTGWRVIGCTDFTLVKFSHSEPFVLQPGDRVQFVCTELAA